MILSTLDQSERIECLHPHFKVLFSYLKQHDLLNAELGRIEIDGDNLFINNVNPQMLEASKQPLEVHEAYIDVHIPLDKAETIGWMPLKDCTQCKQPFDSAQDCALYVDVPSLMVTVQPGEFLVVYPEDAHAPIIGEGKIRKLIAKIKL